MKRKMAKKNVTIVIKKQKVLSVPAKKARKIA